MTDNQRDVRLYTLLMALAARRVYDQQLGTRANYRALVGFLDGLFEDDFWLLTERLGCWPSTSREEATRRLVARPRLQRDIEAVVVSLGATVPRRAGRSA